MHFTYILKSKKLKKLYLGHTNNLQKRFVQHNQGLVKSTKSYLPWGIIYYEAYFSKEDAVHREQNLKLRANAWNQLKLRIRKSIQNAN